MHQVARDALADKLRSARDPEARDRLLDQWADWQFRATEWDADQWGIPDADIGRALRAHAKLGGPRWPREVI